MKINYCWIVILLSLSACGGGAGSEDGTNAPSSTAQVSSVAVSSVESSIAVSSAEVSSLSAVSSSFIASSISSVSSIAQSSQAISSTQSSQLSSTQTSSWISSQSSSRRFFSSRSSSLSRSSVQSSSVMSLSSVSSSHSSSNNSSSSSSSFDNELTVECVTGTSSPLYVKATYSGTSNGSLAQPYKNVQDAVNAASSNMAINVATGTYSGQVNVSGKTVHLCGGWSPNFSVRNPELYPATLTSSGSTAVRLTNARTTSLVGFTIKDSRIGVGIVNDTGNSADSDPLLAGNIIEDNGVLSMDDGSGGVTMDGGFLTLTKNIIRNNQGGLGAAVYLQGVSATLQGNIIDSNEGGGDHGGAAYLVLGDGYVFDNLIKSNSQGSVATYGWGGGMIVDGGRADFKGNIWTDNYSVDHGGGLFVDEGAQVTMANDLFYNNRCSKEGGDAIALDQSWDFRRSKLTATNITVVENSSCGSVSAILMETATDLILKNSIVWSRTGTIDIHFQEGNSTANISYSIYRTVFGDGSGGNELTNGTGNSSSDPLFANPAIHDYHLKSIGGRYDPTTDFWEMDAAHSPAIDAGDPASNYSQETSPNGGRINMGAYGNTVEASRSD